MTRTTALTRRDYLIPLGLMMLGLVPALAGTVRVLQVVEGAPLTPENARFFAAPVPLLLHIPAAILYSLVGALQFSPGLRRRSPRWHRTSGRVLLPLGAIVALTGLWMTLSYPWPAGDGLMVYLERLIVGTAMFLALVLGVDAIRARDFRAHGEWMTRAYALGLGAGTQVLTHLPWFILADAKPGELARGIMMGGGWVINIVVAEWVIRRDRQPARREARGTAPALA